MGGDSVVVMSTRDVDDDATALVAGTVTLLPSLAVGWRDAIA